MGFLTGDYREQIVPHLPAEELAEILSELDHHIREEVLEIVAPATLAKALEDLDSDDAAGRHRRPRRCDPRAGAGGDAGAGPLRDRGQPRLRGRDRRPAGLQREVALAPQFWTVGQAIDYLRGAGDSLPGAVFDLYVVDPAMRRGWGRCPSASWCARAAGRAQRDHGADHRHPDRHGPGRGRLHLRQIPPDLGAGGGAGRAAGGARSPSTTWWASSRKRAAENMLALANVSDAGRDALAWPASSARGCRGWR